MQYKDIMWRIMFYKQTTCMYVYMQKTMSRGITQSALELRVIVRSVPINTYQLFYLRINPFLHTKWISDLRQVYKFQTNASADSRYQAAAYLNTPGFFCWAHLQTKVNKHLYHKVVSLYIVAIKSDNIMLIFLQNSSVSKWI